MRARAGKRICLTFLAACSVLWLTSVVRAQPTILSAVGEFDGGTSNQFVDVTFSQAMSSATAIDTANYAIAGYTITNAMFYTNGRGATSLNLVILQLGTQLTGDFTLSASNVQTSSGASIASNTVVAGTLDALTSIDITSPSAATPSVWHAGTTFLETPATYLAVANGQDIWNTQDGFRYLYETRTNNFAVVVQVYTIQGAAPWSKAGLMAREQIDPNDGGSRMAAVFATPPSGQTTYNGSAGENTIAWDVRDTTDSAAYEPADYVGDGHITPSYPHVWLLLTRQTSVSAAGTNDFFSAYSSTNKTSWKRVGGFNPVAAGANTPFPPVVDVGLCSSTGWSDSFTNNDAFVTVEYENFGDYSDDLFLTNSPQSLTVENGSSATFSVVAGSDATLINQYGASLPFLLYQWYTNGVAVAGATGSSYTIPFATTNLNNLPVYCAITAIGSSGPTNSATATLTVTPNPTPPTIASVNAVYNSVTGDQYVYLIFNEAANAVSLTNPANYEIAGYSITSVTLVTNEQGSVDSTGVILDLNGELTNNFTLGVTGVESYSGVPMATNTTVAGVTGSFFGNGLNWKLSGTSDEPTLIDDVLTLTTNGAGEAASAFFETRQFVGSFTASYTYLASGNMAADGTTFCIQNASTAAHSLGAAGGGLGFNGIGNSAAFEINIYTGASGGYGIQFGVGGATPGSAGTSGTVAPPYAKPGSVDPTSGDPINVQIAYSSDVFSVKLVDLATGDSFSTNYLVNLPAVVGKTNMAYIGFTSGDGGAYSTQQILNFSFNPITAVTVVPAPLAVAPGAAGAVLISWPTTAASSFALQQSSSLVGPWANVTNMLTQVGGRNQVSVTASASAQFYRLMSPP